jgi:hypothetical protein
MEASEPESAFTLPDPDLPLSKQLELALASLRRSEQTLADHKGKLADTRRMADDLQRRLKETEAAAAAKDRIINDLRLQASGRALTLKTGQFEIYTFSRA